MAPIRTVVARMPQLAVAMIRMSQAENHILEVATEIETDAYNTYHLQPAGGSSWDPPVCVHASIGLLAIARGTMDMPYAAV